MMFFSRSFSLNQVITINKRENGKFNFYRHLKTVSDQINRMKMMMCPMMSMCLQHQTWQI